MVNHHNYDKDGDFDPVEIAIPTSTCMGWSMQFCARCGSGELKEIDMEYQNECTEYEGE